MKKIIILKTTSWAQKEPHLPILHFYKDEIKEVDDYIANRMIETGFAKLYEKPKKETKVIKESPNKKVIEHIEEKSKKKTIKKPKEKLEDNK